MKTDRCARAEGSTGVYALYHRCCSHACAALQVAERELSPEKFEVKKKKLTKKRDEFAKVAWMISIGMKRQPLPDKLNPEWEEEAAVACAVQNIYLMTSALGLGGKLFPALCLTQSRAVRLASSSGALVVVAIAWLPSAT